MTQVASLAGGATHGALMRQGDLAVANFANAILTVVVAVCMTALPVFAHILHPALGLLSAALLAGICAWRMPSIAIVAIFFALLYQNFFVSLAAGHIVSDDDFDVIAKCIVFVVAALAVCFQFVPMLFHPSNMEIHHPKQYHVFLFLFQLLLVKE